MSEGDKQIVLSGSAQIIRSHIIQHQCNSKDTIQTEQGAAANPYPFRWLGLLVPATGSSPLGWIGHPFGVAELDDGQNEMRILRMRAPESKMGA